MIPGSVTQDATVDTNLIAVELYGIVYIYNPANKDQIAVAPPAEGQAQAPDGQAPDGQAPAPEGQLPEGQVLEGQAPATDSAPPADENAPAPAPADATPAAGKTAAAEGN
jgi:hypothetical protein